MTIQGNDKIYKTDALKEAETETRYNQKPISLKNVLEAYVQGAVYQWLKRYSETGLDTFSAKDLFGASNTDWSHTPLDYLYEFYEDKAKKCMFSQEEIEKYAFNEAGKNVGWLLKEVLHNDPRFIVDNNQWDYTSRIYKILRRK